MTLLRMAWFVLHSCLALIVCGTLVLLIGFFDHKKNITGKITRLWGKWILMMSGISPQVIGLNNLKAYENYIFVSNHESLLDIPVALSLLPKNIIFLTKKELFSIPFFGWAMNAAGMIKVNRQNREEAKKSVDIALSALKTRNISVLVYPEGTRSEPGEILPFKKGSFILAIQSGLKIVPVSTIGTGMKLRRKAMTMNSTNTIQLMIHEPIPTFGLDANEDKMELLHHAQTVIEQNVVPGN